MRRSPHASAHSESIDPCSCGLVTRTHPVEKELNQCVIASEWWLGPLWRQHC